ncbi:MAG: hypothetical protein RLN82_10080, partial [Pseudomonadales bacterium]
MSQTRKINFRKTLAGLALITGLVLQGQNTLLAQPLYPRAPDVIPGTLPEMREAGFWVARMESPDKTILDLAEIHAMNHKYHQKMGDFSNLEEELVESINNQLSQSPGLLATMPDIGSQTPS